LERDVVDVHTIVLRVLVGDEPEPEAETCLALEGRQSVLELDELTSGRPGPACDPRPVEPAQGRPARPCAPRPAGPVHGALEPEDVRVLLGVELEPVVHVAPAPAAEVD